MAIPLISDLLERFFGPAEDPQSRDDVKRRLKIVLAHDRLALDPQTLEMMRQEIIAVVSRYVEVDFDALEFSLATDQRVTALTANLPIRRIRPLGREADEPIAPEAEAEKIELGSGADILAMDAEPSAAEKRRRFEANLDSDDPVHAPLDIDRSGMGEDAADAALADGILDADNGEDAVTAEVATEEPTLDVPDMSAPDKPFGIVGQANSETT